MNRRHLLGLTLCVPVLATPGCITSRMYEEKKYVEEIKGVLISADKKTLVVVGAKYHYVFKAPAAVLAALGPELHPLIESASFQSFKVDGNNKIQGELALFTKRGVGDAEMDVARQAGFQQSGSRMEAAIAMHGERFSAGHEAALPLQALNKKYMVTITEASTSAEKALKAVATPVTVAADGAIVIGAVVLSPIWLPLLISNLCFVCK